MTVDVAAVARKAAEEIADPVAAAAWTFNVTRTEYAALEAAC